MSQKFMDRRVDDVNLDTAFVVFDENGRIRDANQIACDQLGYTNAELCRLEMLTLAPEFRLAEIIVALAGAAGRLVPWSGRLQRRAGDLLAVRGRLIAIHNGEGPLFMALFGRFDAVSGTAAAGICTEQLADDLMHRLNNLMTIIQVHASYLLSEEQLDHEAADSVREIYAAVNRAAELTIRR